MYDEKKSDIEMTVFVFIRHKTAKFKEYFRGKNAQKSKKWSFILSC